MEKKRRIQRFGSIPFGTFKEKIRIINELRTKIPYKTRISIENDSSVIFYEYWELQ
jgi:hypothetical protein